VNLEPLGPFFETHVHDAGATPSAPWRPMSELVTDPAVLAGRVRTVREYLAAGGGQPPDAVAPRVAASVTHLGLVARLVSPVLAVAVGDGALLDVDLAATWWQSTIGGAFPLSVPAGAATVDPARLAELVAARVLDGPVRTLGAAVRAGPVSGAAVPAGPVSGAAVRAGSVSDRVLWGNVASAVHGAVSMIVSARSPWAERATALAAALLDLPPLAGTGAVVDGRFRRRSCCLIYRAAPAAAGPVCGDCVLGPTRSRRAAAET
jgi:hypothetical protein